MIWDFHGYGGIAAIREGNWKALRRNLRKAKPADWELYDLADDPQESTDLAQQHPDIVKRLELEYLQNRSVEPEFPLPIYDEQTSSLNSTDGSSGSVR